ncbi:hypothetical protein F5148DRAFT_1354088 [Russula earlei]|uniref:Uncharacterized protein n=1 Tax=Russula earlei TaxID=71964 RepID=A0ACC0UAD2_9AGAM|nr:hypothetical protein F5148DRAFT_1354088 [Russula earlei]
MPQPLPRQQQPHQWQQQCGQCLTTPQDVTTHSTHRTLELHFDGRTVPNVEMTEEHEREEDLTEEEMIMWAIVMSMHPEAESDVQGMWNVSQMIVHHLTSMRDSIQKNTATREAAELANRSKSEFLANMSHKIRLAWWIGYLKNRSWSDDHGASLLLAPADCFRNRPRITEQLGPHLLDPDILDQLIGDSLCLWQVIADLVGNAINVSLEFCVLDTGIGIAKDKLNFNFDTFAQADGSTDKEGIRRNGIGLSILKRLVALMAGSMQG